MAVTAAGPSDVRATLEVGGVAETVTVEGKGTFIIEDERIIADEKTAIMCAPMVPHGFSADQGERLVVLAVVTPAETE